MATVQPGGSNTIYWLALSLTPGLGPTRGRKLVKRYGAIQDIFHASLTELESQGVQAHSAQSIVMGKSLELAHEEYAKAVSSGVAILSKDDANWPSSLGQIYDPPLLLYVRGNVEAVSQPGIAIIGTRLPTPYGIGMAERLACDLAARGLVIFSGLARGVDAASHRGAIQGAKKGAGSTVAVFGTGVDVIYPKENQKIAQGILESGGALVSEFALNTFPAPQNFPIRNRIISGLSLGVLVVEAAEHSGSRITARCALEQSRELFAVPGHVTSKNSWGPNTLIKQGAKLTATWEDVWEELPASIRQEVESRMGAAASENQPQTGKMFPENGLAASERPDGKEKLSPGERKVLSILSAHESTHIDEIMEKLEGQLSSAEVFTVLFELELNSKIRQLPGKNFVKSI